MLAGPPVKYIFILLKVSKNIYNTSYTMLNQTVYILIQKTIRKTIPTYDKNSDDLFQKAYKNSKQVLFLQPLAVNDHNCLLLIPTRSKT